MLAIVIALAAVLCNVMAVLALGFVVIIGLLLWYGWLPSWLWWPFIAALVWGAVEGIVDGKK